MNTFTKALLASAIAVLAYPVIAAGPASAPRYFQQDMSKELHMKYAEERFDALDTNKDGKITTEERAAQRPGRGMGPGASMPAEISKADHMKYAEERFTALDTNKDGKITADERAAQRAAKRSGRDGGRYGAVMVDMTRDQFMKMSQDRFDAMDTNKDGKIGADEVGRQGGMNRGKHYSGHRGSGQGWQGQGRWMPPASAPAAK